MSYQSSTFGRRLAVGRAPSLLKALMSLDALYRSRRALSSLDNDRLADLGLDAESARSEAKRPVWDVPAGWRSSCD